MNSQSYRRMIWFLVLILGAVWTGCSSKDDDDPPIEDRGVALESVSYIYNQAIQGQITPLYQVLLYRAQQIAPHALSSGQVDTMLQQMIISQDDYFAAAGITDTEGIIQRSRPVDRAGESLADNPYIQNVLQQDTPALAAARLENNTQRRFDLYTPVRDGSDIVGVLWAECKLDTVIRRSVTYTLDNDTLSREAFIVDWEGRVVYDRNPSFFGQQVPGSASFNQSTRLVVEAILDSSAGHREYTSTNSLGAGETGGDRLVGWSRIALIDAWWTIALTEPR